MTLRILFQNNTQPSTMEIFSLDGELLCNEQITSMHQAVNVSSLSKGTYLLRVSNTEKTMTSKFVVH